MHMNDTPISVIPTQAGCREIKAEFLSGTARLIAGGSNKANISIPHVGAELTLRLGLYHSTGSLLS